MRVLEHYRGLFSGIITSCFTAICVCSVVIFVLGFVFILFLQIHRFPRVGLREPSVPSTRNSSDEVFEYRDSVHLSNSFHHGAVWPYASDVVWLIDDFPTLTFVKWNC